MNKPTQMLSQPSKQSQVPVMLPAAKQNLIGLSEPLRRLCSMKNQVQLTPHALETWVAALSVFDPRIVNQAVLEIGLSTDPFPDLGKLVLRCDAIRCKGQNISVERKTVGTKALHGIAHALNLELPRA